jgi:cation diffusion facilitator family transporter
MADAPSQRRVVVISFAVDLLDIASNLVVVVLTGSAVIFAEMAQGIADALGSLFLVTGDRRSRRPRDAAHPLGYGRQAFFWALLSALVMLTAGVGLATLRGMQQLLDPTALDRPALALGVLCVSIATNGYATSQSLRKLRAEEGSLARSLRSARRPLVRTALLQDGLGTLSSIVGLFAVAASLVTGIEVLDGVGALAIAGLMAVAAVVLVVQAQSLITGEAVAAEVLEQIRATVRSVPAVVAVNRLAAVHSGSAEILVEVDLDLDEDLQTTEIEAAIDEVQQRVREAVPEVRAVRVDLNSPLPGANFAEER